MLKRITAVVLVLGFTLVNTGSLRAQADADAAELANYRLTKEGLDKYIAVTRSMLAEMQKDPKFKEMEKLTADIKALEEKEELTEAEQAKLEELQKKKEALEESMDGGLSLSDAKTLTDMETRIKQTPQMAGALQSAGFPAREYAKFTLVMFQAAMVVGFKKAGLVKELPKEISAENVKFVEEHEKELEAFQKEMQARPKGGGV